MAGSSLSRRPKILAAIVGLVIFMFLFIAGLWQIERLPSNLREWLYLRMVHPAGYNEGEPSEFDFFVVGHLYGSPGVDDQMPARLLLQRLPEIVTAEPNFMVSLGDVVFQKNEIEFANLHNAILNNLTFPFYNTPGNHDVANDRSLYDAHFGSQSYLAKEYGSAHLIFLDTERVECGLDATQLKFLEQEIEKAIVDSETRFIFVFMHKALVFQNAEMKALRNEAAMPNVWDCQNKNGSNPFMDNIFKPAARQKPVYIFAGDVGAWGNLSPYYQRDSWLPLTLVMTGLGDTAQDNIVRVHVSPNGIDMDVLFLKEMQSASLEDYSLKYWLNIAREE